MRKLLALLVLFPSCAGFGGQQEIAIPIDEVTVIAGWVAQADNFDTNKDKILQNSEFNAFMLWLTMQAINRWAIVPPESTNPEPVTPET